MTALFVIGFSFAAKCSWLSVSVMWSQRKLTELTYDSATKAIDTPDTANEQEVSIGDDQKLISLKVRMVLSRTSVF